MTPARLRKLMTGYYGMVKCIDDNVGKIVDVLREKDILDRTIVVFTADHGDLCGEHGRLNKGVPYEGSARIPFVVRYPARIRAGTVVPQALSCVDFLPTMMRLMDVDHDAPTEGRDASALFTGDSGAIASWDDLAFLRSTSGKTHWLCAVSDRHKLVYSNVDRPWLFDLKLDPQELKNRFDDPEYRDIARELTRGLQRYGKRFSDPYVEEAEIRAAIEATLAVGAPAGGATDTSAGATRPSGDS